MFYFSQIKTDKNALEKFLNYKSESGALLYINAQELLTEEDFNIFCSICKDTNCRIFINDIGFDDIYKKSEYVKAFIQNLRNAESVLNRSIYFEAGYSLEQVEYANSKIDFWVEDINSCKVHGRELSPLEKYIACYLKATNFAYKLEESDESCHISRSIPFVLDPTNDRICCVGFSNLLVSLTNRCGIDCEQESVKYWYEDDGHAMCAIHLVDKVYNKDTIFRADPTAAEKRFGRILSGIWLSYNLVKNKYRNEYSGERTMGIDNVDIFEKLSQTSLDDVIVKPTLASGDDNFEQNNYWARLEAFIVPVIKKIITTLEPSQQTTNLMSLSNNFRKVCSELIKLFEMREEGIAILVRNPELTEEELQEKFNRELNTFNKKLEKLIRPICEEISAFIPNTYHYNWERVITNQIKEIVIDEHVQKFLAKEEKASKNYLCMHSIAQNSEDMDPYTLALAVKNLYLAKGYNVIEACKLSANILAKSAVDEFYVLKKHDMLNSSEVFSVLLQEPFVTHEDVINFSAEQQENIDAVQINKELKQDKILTDYSTRNRVADKIFYRLNYLLLAQSFNETLKDEKIKQEYSDLFIKYPFLNDRKALVFAEDLKAYDYGEHFFKQAKEKTR